MTNIEYLSFLIPKRHIKQIENFEEEYDVIIDFEEVGSSDLYCQIQYGQGLKYEEKELLIFHDERFNKNKKVILINFIDKYLEQYITQIPAVELLLLKRRLDNNDFSVGDSFWIKNIEFKVVSKGVWKWLNTN